MLYIVTKDGQEVEWHTGKKVPKIDPQDVVEIQADCDELEHVKWLFTNRIANPYASTVEIYTIPLPKGRVARWFGDFARTIYCNLGNEV